MRGLLWLFALAWLAYGVFRMVRPDLAHVAARLQRKSEAEAEQAEAAEGPRTTPSRFLLVHVLPVVLLFLVASSVVQVEAGSAAAVLRFGKVQGYTLNPGLHVVIPVADRVRLYRTQQVVYETSDDPGSSQATFTDYSIDTMTKDGQRIRVRFTAVVQIDPGKVGEIAQTIGTERDVIEKVVKANARSEGRNIPKSFEARQLYGEEVYKCQEAIRAKLEPVFKRNGVVLVEFLLRDIGFNDALADALEQKQIALENVVTAQRNIEKARAEASQTIVAAQGEKIASITRAQGEAEAARLLQQQLSKNPAYSQYVLAKGIADGKTGIDWSILPSNAVPFLNIPQRTAQTTP